MSDLIIHWFRRDLRLDDIPALHAAASAGQRVLACYIDDPASAGDMATGAASRWWLHYSLAELDSALREHGGGLYLARGDTVETLLALARDLGASSIYCSRCHEPWERDLEERLHTAADAAGLQCKRFGGTLLREPEQVSTQSGGPFRVYTPFWRFYQQQAEPALAGEAPAALTFEVPPTGGLALEQLELLPMQPDWAAHWPELWQPGERGAQARLGAFLDGELADYDAGRDFPAQSATTGLSAALHFGNIAPARMWHRIAQARLMGDGLDPSADKLQAQLVWREFSTHLLFHFPHMVDGNYRAEFDRFPWREDADALRAWQRGETGYPIVDAGMRELWQTGYMHNRVRMIVASFLTKHLLIDWREGERWFRDTLVDADLGNNVCSWQWVAGSGCDAAPYFRIFNPTLQGEKFDAAGEYIRRWVPELAEITGKALHRVSDNPGVVSGYPPPLVVHKEARGRALDAYAAIKQT